MSRLGKKPIQIPEKTELSISGGFVAVKGHLGEIRRPYDSRIEIQIADGKATLTPRGNTNEAKALWGSYVSHIKNMLAGVNKPFEKKLIIEGIGFKAEVKGKEIIMNLGFSHPVKVEIPEGIKVVSEKGVLIISGIDIEAVGKFSAQIRDLKKPEPYKGKGIRYDGEVIKRKQGKKAV